MECCRLRLLPNVLEWEGESISGAEEPRLVLVLGRRAFPCFSLLGASSSTGLGVTFSALCSPLPGCDLLMLYAVINAPLIGFPGPGAEGQWLQQGKGLRALPTSPSIALHPMPHC